MRDFDEIAVLLFRASQVPQENLIYTFGKWSAWAAPHGNLEDVIEAVGEYFGATPTGYNFFQTLSSIYYRLGDHELALDYFHRCIGPTPEQKPEPQPIEAEYATYDYDENSIHHDTVAAFMQFASKWITPCHGGTIIDAACGSGLAAQTLRPHAGTLIGIDISATMVGRAQACGLYDRVIETDMNAALADMTTSADAVVCSGATYYLPDLAPFMASCATALRPGGILLFSDFSTPDHMETGTTFGGTFRHCRSKAHTRALAAHAGFTEAAVGIGIAFTCPCLYWAFRRAD